MDRSPDNFPPRFDDPEEEEEFHRLAAELEEEFLYRMEVFWVNMGCPTPFPYVHYVPVPVQEHPEQQAEVQVQHPNPNLEEQTPSAAPPAEASTVSAAAASQVVHIMDAGGIVQGTLDNPGSDCDGEGDSDHDGDDADGDLSEVGTESTVLPADHSSDSDLDLESNDLENSQSQQSEEAGDASPSAGFNTKRRRLNLN